MASSIHSLGIIVPLAPRAYSARNLAAARVAAALDAKNRLTRFPVADIEAGTATHHPSGVALGKNSGILDMR